MSDGHYSHRPSHMKQSNKPFKSKHSTKGQIKENQKGKVNRSSSHQKSKAQASKADRRNAAKIAQKNKRDELMKLARSVGGSTGAPKIVAVFSPCPDINPEDVLKKIISCPDLNCLPKSKTNVITGYMEKFKQKLTFIHVPKRIDDILEAAKVADFMICVFSAEEEVDSHGELCLSTILAQGVPSIVNVVEKIEKVAIKKRSDIKKALISYIADFFPNDQKLFTIENDGDVLNILRHISSSHPHSLAWRDQHPYMIVDSFEHEEGDDPDHVTLKVQGYSRGRPFSANRLVHLQNYGDFQLKLIAAQTEPIFAEKEAKKKMKQKGDVEMEDSEGGLKVIDEASEELQETLVSENTPDPFANEQTWPTEEELEEAEKLHKINVMEKATKKKKVPKGMSSYMAAWIVDSDDEDEDEDDDEEGSSIEDGMNVDGKKEEEEQGEEEEGEEEEYEEVEPETRSVTFDQQIDEEQERKDLEEFKRMKETEEEDLENPDHIDLDSDSSAKQRLSKYRGLKSFRTSPWDPYENLPLEYGKIFDFENFKRTQKRVLSADDGVPPSSYIVLYIKNVPKEFITEEKKNFFSIFGLNQHEHKVSVLHFAITKHSTCTDVIKSKQELIMYSGYRKQITNPIFSQHTKGDKHKFERYLPDGASVASVFGPIQFLPCPVLFFKREEGKEDLELVASGSLLEVQPKRVICKRVVLTGHAFKINRRHATVRFMFFNPDDVNWFKPIQLQTKSGKAGHIKESLGTHGYMKCVFNGQLKTQEEVYMNLYKRVYPVWKSELFVNKPN